MSYRAPSTYTISGYVYDDLDEKGVRQTGDTGVANAQLTLDVYLPSNLEKIIATYTATSDSSGEYTFNNLQPGDYYTIVKTDPAGYSHTPYGHTPNTIGNYHKFLGWDFDRSVGYIHRHPEFPDHYRQHHASGAEGWTGSAWRTAFGPNASGGKYAAANHNFGLVGRSGDPRFHHFAGASGANDRLLAGPGGTLALTGTVRNSGSPGSSSLSWHIASSSTGLDLTPDGRQNLAAGDHAHHGSRRRRQPQSRHPKCDAFGFRQRSRHNCPHEHVQRGDRPGLAAATGPGDRLPTAPFNVPSGARRTSLGAIVPVPAYSVTIEFQPRLEPRHLRLRGRQFAL